MFNEILSLGIEFQIAFGIIFFILGLVMGSFLECLADRSVKNVSILKKTRSYCPKCNHDLKWHDLFPIFSYMFLRGKCRYCKAKIPPRHLVCEIIAAVSFTLIYIKYGLSIDTFAGTMLICTLLPASLCDIDTKRVSNSYFIVLAGAFIICAISKILLFGFINTKDYLIDAALGGIAVPLALFIISLVMDVILKKNTLGGADIKILFSIGLFLGLEKQILGLLLMCIIGLVYIVVKKVKRGKQFALVPFISISSFICFLVGDIIIDAYLSLFI